MKRWPWQRGRLRFQLDSNTAVYRTRRVAMSSSTFPPSTSPTPTSKVKNAKKGYSCVLLWSAIVDSLLREFQTSRHQSPPQADASSHETAHPPFPTHSAGQSHLKSGPIYTITYVCMSACETASPREGKGPDQNLPPLSLFSPSRRETSQDKPQYKKKVHNTKESV